MRRTTISREQYIQRHLVIRNRLAKVYNPLVEKVIRKYYDEVAAHVRDHGVHKAQGMIHGDSVLNGMASTIQALYAIAIQLATKQNIISDTPPAVKAITASFGRGPLWLQRVLKFLEKYLLSEVVLPISDTTIRQVDELLQEALDKGWSSEETAKRLEDSELPKWRARLIVRTETVRATNVAQMVQADQSPYEMEKMWIAIEDNRTRKSHSHEGVDGERIGLYEEYSNGLRFPGDPKGGAKEVCNCRCCQGFFAKRDLSGNLVLKQRTADLDLAKLFN